MFKSNRINTSYIHVHLLFIALLRKLKKKLKMLNKYISQIIIIIIIRTAFPFMLEGIFFFTDLTFIDEQIQ